MHIIGLSGKKSSGKNTGANFLFGSGMVAAGSISHFSLNQKGELVVPASHASDGSISDMIFDPLTRNKQAQQWLAHMVWPVVKLYSFANPLKEFCRKVFGLTEAQCYGTDADKNSLTALKWEDMPDVTTNELLFQWYSQNIKTALEIDKIYEDPNFIVRYHKSGPMTAREVLQYFGTDVCRKMSRNCWVEATIREIQEDKPDLAIITDVRFPNEADGIKAAGGITVRLTRNPYPDDAHSSELALDEYNKFDLVLDNSSMSIAAQNNELLQRLKAIKQIPWANIAPSNP